MSKNEISSSTLLSVHRDRTDHGKEPRSPTSHFTQILSSPKSISYQPVSSSVLLRSVVAYMVVTLRASLSGTCRKPVLGVCTVVYLQWPVWLDLFNAD